MEDEGSHRSCHLWGAYRLQRPPDGARLWELGKGPDPLLMHTVMSAQAYSRRRGLELAGLHGVTGADLEPFGLSLSPLPFMLTQLRDPGL